ncbi:MAG TPA: helix-turn-helix domain-containing protein [Syntrophorhabdus sp.]|jgi:predicted DNA-binding transcriptional regulator AlpA|nr:MAG: Helix-turn-helix domain protein [Syntrophorhabdus sp. PtaB.Bin027]OQB77920.1 MAG: Helix-turn-helix domain protein [Deltaproteobacteria bacterium ADurb.Bin135]HPB36673.1 helix-turn-helix domain-containing protein [Syntrophorhabdus sp.]HPW35557.1 helix-turn-helix domain-containing protein [Syntrophorhabdus sp.]HQP54879.1 helix-turn-helix domain-containing protein [Syntrophorhabdus sp.]
MNIDFQLSDQDIDSIVDKLEKRLRHLLSKQSYTSDNEYLDVKSLSEYLHVSKSWVYERTHLNEIPFIKLPSQQGKRSNGTTSGKVLFKRSAIDAWLERNSVPEISQSKNGLNLLKGGKAS